MMSHMKTHHKDIYVELTKEWESRCAKRRSLHKKAKEDGKSAPVLNGVRMSGPALQLHSLRLVTEHGLSFKVLDYSAFQDIIGAMRKAMPAKENGPINSRTIPPKISGIADRVRAKLASEMKDRMVSLMVDGVTKGHRCFVGINVQYIKDDEVVVRTLGVEEINVSHSAANIKSIIVATLKKYGVSVKNIVSFTSDNGENYLLTGKLLNADQEEMQLHDCEGMEWDDLVGTELSQDDFKIQCVRCAEHTLQCCIDDAIKANPAVKVLLTRVRELSKLCRDQNNRNQIVAAGLPVPSIDVCTRWGSTYDMVVSVARLRNFLDKTMNVRQQDRDKYFLDSKEWEQLESYISDMSPARKATTKLQAKDLCIGQFFEIWTACKLSTQKNKSRSPLAAELIKSMEKRAMPLMYRDPRRGERLSPLFNYPSFNAAVFLDPRYVSLLSQEEIAQAKTYLCDLWQRMQVLAGPALSPEDENPDDDLRGIDEGLTTSSESEGSEDESFSKLLQRKNRERMLARGGATQQSAMATRRARVKALLDEYDNTAEILPAKASVQKYWAGKRLLSPEVYALACVVLAIPATQVSVERLFSALRFILRPQRYNLSRANVDDITFLHSNADLLKKVVQDLLASPSSPDAKAMVDLLSN